MRMFAVYDIQIIDPFFKIDVLRQLAHNILLAYAYDDSYCANVQVMMDLLTDTCMTASTLS